MRIPDAIDWCGCRRKLGRAARVFLGRSTSRQQTHVTVPDKSYQIQIEVRSI